MKKKVGFFFVIMTSSNSQLRHHKETDHYNVVYKSIRQAYAYIHTLKGCLVALEANYVLLFDAQDWHAIDDSKNNRNSKQKRRSLELLQLSIDLTSIRSYSAETIRSRRSRIKRKQLILYGKQWSSMKIVFEKKDKRLVEHIKECLASNGAIDISDGQQNNNTNTNNNNNDSALLFEVRSSANNNYYRTPFYCVLRGLRIDFYANYAAYHNQNNHASALKSIDILSEIASAEPVVGRRGKWFAFTDKYELRLTLNSDNHLSFIFMSDNARHEFHLHLCFILRFRCMPNKSQMRFSDGDKVAMKALLESSDAEYLATAKKEMREAMYNSDVSESESALRKLKIVDGVYAQWISKQRNDSDVNEEEEQKDDNKAVQSFVHVSNNNSVSVSQRFSDVLSLALNVPPSSILGWYHVSGIGRGSVDIPVCPLMIESESGDDCPVFAHYTRDRGRDRDRDADENKENSNAMAMIADTRERRIDDDISKIHAQLNKHSRDEQQPTQTKTETENKEDDDDKDDEELAIICEKGNNNNKSESDSISKFVIDAGAGNFSFGDACLYWNYYKKSTNFVSPAHPSLFSEACMNTESELRPFCVTPTVFWMFYLQAMYVRESFKDRETKKSVFNKARDIAASNFQSTAVTANSSMDRMCDGCCALWTVMRAER